VTSVLRAGWLAIGVARKGNADELRHDMHLVVNHLGQLVS
jgi:hypothetical protein